MRVVRGDYIVGERCEASLRWRCCFGRFGVRRWLDLMRGAVCCCLLFEYGLEASGVVGESRDVRSGF